MKPYPQKHESIIMDESDLEQRGYDKAMRLVIKAVEDIKSSFWKEYFVDQDRRCAGKVDAADHILKVIREFGK